MASGPWSKMGAVVAKSASYDQFACNPNPKAIYTLTFYSQNHKGYNSNHHAYKKNHERSMVAYTDAVKDPGTVAIIIAR